MFNADQSRAARALLNWSQSDLAEATNISMSVIKHFESGAHMPHKRNLQKLQAAYAALGVEFINCSNQRYGVILNIHR